MRPVAYTSIRWLPTLALLCACLPSFAARPEEARVEALLERMQALFQAREHRQLIEAFGDAAIADWPADWSAQAARALHLRGQAYQRLNDLEKAAADLSAAVTRSPGNGYYWQTLGDNLRDRGDDAGALQAYLQAYERVAAAHTSTPRGWMPISATLNAAAILRDQGRYAEALEVLDRYDAETIKDMGYWGERALRARADVYAGKGRDREALELFRLANKLRTERGN